MSPEQARGKPLDKRTDIWSFGAVLYEMLTGKRLFTGETSSDILAAVIATEPSLEGLPADLRPIVEKCLRKDSRKRWQSIGDVRLALEERGTTVAVYGAATPSRLQFGIAVWTAIITAAFSWLAFVHFFLAGTNAFPDSCAH
jgi:serine/threonine-protein kinase